MDSQSMLQKQLDYPKKQVQILEAAIDCVKKWGIERVSLNDIAYEAKVARSTVYSYYRNKDDVVRAALLWSAYSFGEKLFEYAFSFDSPEQRLIEAIVHALDILPNEPAMALISDSALSQMVHEHTLTTPEGLDIGTALIQMMLGEREYASGELEEISELAIRFVLSLLMVESPLKRSNDELRGFIARRLLPAIGLSTPEPYRYKRATA